MQFPLRCQPMIEIATVRSALLLPNGIGALRNLMLSWVTIHCALHLGGGGNSALRRRAASATTPNSNGSNGCGGPARPSAAANAGLGTEIIAGTIQSASSAQTGIDSLAGRTAPSRGSTVSNVRPSRTNRLANNRQSPLAADWHHAARRRPAASVSARDPAIVSKAFERRSSMVAPRTARSVSCWLEYILNSDWPKAMPASLAILGRARPMCSGNGRI